MISPFALKSLISSEDIATWMLHLRVDDKLVRDSFLVRKLPKLRREIDEWKEVRERTIVYLLKCFLFRCNYIQFLFLKCACVVAVNNLISGCEMDT
jgi:hypothetical protein